MRQQKLLAGLAGIFVASAGLSAHAADLGEPAPPVAGYNWTGLYVGIGGGSGAVVHEIDIPPLGGFNFNGIGGEGTFGEVTAGYDFLLGERFLLGANVGYRMGNIETTLDIGAPLAFSAAVTLDEGYDLIGRMGYLVTPQTLAYVLGGYSHQHFDLSTSVGFALDWDQDGRVVGAGMESVLGGNWTLKAEYRYAEYEAEDFGTAGFFNVIPSTHAFHAGLNYRFGGGNGAAASSFAPVSHDFTGLKIGVAAGAGAVVHEIGLPPLLGFVFNGIGGEGHLGEISIGYDWQMANNWVVGVMAGYRQSNIATDLSIPEFVGFAAAVEADEGYDLIARLGYKINDGTLAYALAGYSAQHFDLTTNVGFGLDWDTHGWTAGGGLETALNERWTAKIEYRFAEYDSEDFDTGGFIEVEPSSHTVRAGLGYKLY